MNALVSSASDILFFSSTPLRSAPNNHQPARIDISNPPSSYSKLSLIILIWETRDEFGHRYSSGLSELSVRYAYMTHRAASAGRKCSYASLLQRIHWALGACRSTSSVVSQLLAPENAGAVTGYPTVPMGSPCASVVTQRRSFTQSHQNASAEPTY